MKTLFVNRPLFVNKRSLLGLCFVANTAWAGGAQQGMVCLDMGDLSCAKEVRDEQMIAAPDATETLQLNLRTLFREGHYLEAVAVLDQLEARGVDVAAKDGSPYRPTAEATAGMEETTGAGVIMRQGGGLDRILIDDALTVLERSREVYDGLFGGGPDHDVLLDVFPTARRFIQASGLPPEAVRATGVIALSKWSRLLVSSPRALGRGYGWKDTIAHEYIHLVVAWRTADRTPVWLQEGLAKHLEQRWRGTETSGLTPHQQSILAAAVRDESFVPFEKFKHSMAYLDSGEEAALAFAQVSTMMGYLEAKGETGVFSTVLSRIRDGEEPGLVVAEAASHVNFEGFKAGWLTWLRTQPLIAKEIATMPVVLDGEGNEFDADPLLSARSDLARFARLGDLLRQRGRFVAALVEYRKATDGADGPPSPLMVAKEAACLQSLDQLSEALRIVESSVDLYPEHTLLQVTHGRLLDQLGRPAEAVSAWQQAHDLNPFDPEVQAALAKDWAMLGEPERAARHQRYRALLAFEE
jgi:tetratricopeptide (TPR) repeat protein